MRLVVLVLAAQLALGLSGSAFAQRDSPRERDRGGRGAGAVMKGQDERRREAVPGGERREARPERMRPEEREKLRRDIEDANRNMQKRR